MIVPILGNLLKNYPKKDFQHKEKFMITYLKMKERVKE